MAFGKRSLSTMLDTEISRVAELLESYNVGYSGYGRAFHLVHEDNLHKVYSFQSEHRDGIRALFRERYVQMARFLNKRKKATRNEQRFRQKYDGKKLKVGENLYFLAREVSKFQWGVGYKATLYRISDDTPAGTLYIPMQTNKDYEVLDENSGIR